jgi:hypothetical protein
MTIFDITAIKDFKLSPDGKEATFALVTRYAGDLGVKAPTELLAQLQPEAEHAAPIPAPFAQPHPAASPPSPPPLPSNQSPSAPTTDRDIGDKPPGGLVVKVPKSWSAAIDKQRGYVVAMFDQKTPAPYGFALHPDAAKKLAAALVTQADAIGGGSENDAYKIGLNP